MMNCRLPVESETQTVNLRIDRDLLGRPETTKYS